MGKSCVLGRNWELLPIATYLSIVNVNPFISTRNEAGICTYIQTPYNPVSYDKDRTLPGSVDSLM